MAGDKYADARSFFVNNERPVTVADVARRYGVKPENLKQIAWKQNWQRLRDERLNSDNEKLSQARDAKLREDAERIAQLWSDARMDEALLFRGGQATQSKATKALLARETPPTAQEARALRGASGDGVRALHLATGEPTERVEMAGGLTLTHVDRAVLDAMIAKAMQEWKAQMRP
jgi:hypothetical protein